MWRPAGSGPHAAPRDARLAMHERPGMCRAVLVAPAPRARALQVRTRKRCARIAARLQHLLYVSTPQRVLLSNEMASALHSPRFGQLWRESSTARRAERT